MPENDPFHGLDVELGRRPRFLEGSVRLLSGELIPVHLTWQAWEEATGQSGPALPSVDDPIALRAAWLAATDDRYSGRVVDGRFRLIEAGYIRDAIRLSAD
jgi:hypothetical protein